jgi:hypothetical protein
MSPELRAEWLAHARAYAIAWLRNMIATKRFDSITPDWPDAEALLDAGADQPGEIPGAIAKDLHVVSLGMATDRRVVSLDDAQRRLLRRVHPRVPGLASLHWANPTDERVVPWLRNGAPDEPALQVPSGP